MAPDITFSPGGGSGGKYGYRRATARGLPRNVVFVADTARSVDAAMLEATAAPVGGPLQLRSGGTVADVDALQLPAGVDRVSIVSTASDTEVPWLLIAVRVGLAILGLSRLVAVRRRGRRGMAPAAGGS